MSCLSQNDSVGEGSGDQRRGAEDAEWRGRWGGKVGMSADTSAKSSCLSLRCGRGPSALRKPAKGGGAPAIGFSGEPLPMNLRQQSAGTNWREGSPPSPWPSPPGEGMAAARFGRTSSFVSNPASARFMGSRRELLSVRGILTPALSPSEGERETVRTRQGLAACYRLSFAFRINRTNAAGSYCGAILRAPRR